jgi:hypothetical protein
MATNNLNLIPSVVSGQVSIPQSANGTGTIVTNKLGVTGTGTLFLTEMPAGSWIYQPTGNELRKVIEVQSNTYAILESAFTTEIAAAAPAIIDNKKAKAKGYVFTALTAVGTMVDNTGTMVAVLPIGVPVPISKLGNDRTSRADLLSPTIIAPGGGGSILVEIIY